MREAEGIGNSVDEAIEDGCRRLGLERSQVEWELVEAGSRGLWGILGARPFRVVVRERTQGEEARSAASPVGIEETVAAGGDAAAPAGFRRKEEVVQGFLEAVGRSLGFTDPVAVRSDAESIVAELRWGSEEDMGVLIGRGGEVLDALQYLCNVVAARGSGDKRRVVVDVGGYRERHVARLERMARRAADLVRETGESVMLPAMPAADRRIIHVTLGEAEEIVTVSRGEEPSRRVVVALRGHEEEPAAPWEEVEGAARKRNGAGTGRQAYRNARETGPWEALGAKGRQAGRGAAVSGERRVLDRRQEWPVGGPWRRSKLGGRGGVRGGGGQVG